MSPRLATALPVLPAVAHALAMRWAASDLSEHGPFFGEVGDMYRDLSLGLFAFAAVLTLVAVLAKASLARLLGTFLVTAGLIVQAPWLVLVGLIAYDDLTGPDLVGTVEPVIVYAQLGTAVLLVASSIVALVLLRRVHAAPGQGSRIPNRR